MEAMTELLQRTGSRAGEQMQSEFEERSAHRRAAAVTGEQQHTRIEQATLAAPPGS